MKPRLSARFLFAAIGAVACLVAALALEGIYARAHTSSWLSHDAIPVIHFFPHIRNETERRLQQANAKTGDVEITLTWNNLNDLDLHCIDPAGDEIGFRRPVSHKTLGRLDIDQNSGVTFTSTPVEHIYWPPGHAPVGTYRVYVQHYARHGASDPTLFQVTVKNYGRVTRYPGSISRGPGGPGTDPAQFICEFTAGKPPFAFLWLPASFWRALLVVSLWTIVVAVAITSALLLGLHLFYRRVYRKPFMSRSRAMRITIVSVLWSGVAGAIAQIGFVIGAAFFEKLHPTVLHVWALALLGGLVGTALGGRIPHMRRGWAFLAGFLGGALAGLLFMRIYLAFGESTVSELWGRIVIATILGAAIGFVIALVVEPPEEPEEPIEYEDEALTGMQPLSLRANRIGPTGKLRRAGAEPANR